MSEPAVSRQRRSAEGREPSAAGIRAGGAGAGVAALLLAALVLVNAAAVWGILAARRDARAAALRDLELRVQAEARSLEAALASLRADLVFLSRSPPLTHFLAAPVPDDPMARRWSRLDAESTVLLFLEAHPALFRACLMDTGGAPRLVAGRRGGAPVLLPPAEAPPAPDEWIAGRFAMGGGDGAALVAWIDRRALLAATHGEGSGLELEDAAAPPPPPGDGTALVARAAVADPHWEPPVAWRLVHRREAGDLFLSLESLAGRYGTTVGLNLVVMSLSLVVGGVAYRNLRRVARLEAERRQQERVRELERQLQHSERLASIGRLAAGFAHEINNPLEGIANYLALLDEELDAGRSGEARALAGRIGEGVGRAAGVIRQVLSLAEPGNAPTEELDLRRPLADTVAFLRSTPRCRETEVRLTLPPAPLPVRGNPVTLGQLFLNLLLNACQAQPAAGPVEVRAEAAEGEVVVTVEDRGPGLAPEAREHLFEPFSSTRGSTGLGLAVCRGIVRDHGGSIDGEDRAGGGARFTVVLPAAATALREVAG